MSKKLERLQKDAVSSPWGKRIKRMKKYQDENSKTWRRNERVLFGKTSEGSAAGEDSKKKNSINYGWGLIKSLETQIYVQNPDMILDPRDDARRELANIITKVVRYNLDQMDLKSIGNLALMDTFISGYGAVIEDVKTERDGETIVSQEYSARRIHPRDFLLDPRALLLDLSDCRYIALAFYPTIGELRDDPLFKDNLPTDEDFKNFPETFQTTRSDKALNQVMRDPSSFGAKEEDLDYKTICVWEVHDNVAGEILYLTDKDHLKIGEREAPVDLRLGPRKLFPVTILALNQTTMGWYPVPELDLVYEQLTTMNDIQAMIRKDTVTKWRKWVAPAPLVSLDQAAQITDPETDQSVLRIEMDDIGELAQSQHMHELDLRKLIVPLEDISLKRDLPVVKEMTEQDIAKILGYGPIDRGGLPKTRSAREAMAIKEKMEQRLAKRADAISDFYRLFGTKHVQILKQTMDTEKYARVYDEASKLNTWVKYGKTQLDELGEFEFVVYAGSSGPRTTESKRASELQLFQTIAPILQAMQGDLRPAFYRLAKFFQWDGVDELFKNPKGVAKQLAMVLAAMQTQQLPPEALPNAAAAMVQAELSPEEINMVKQALAGNTPSGPRGVVKGERGDPGGNRTVTGAM